MLVLSCSLAYGQRRKKDLTPLDVTELSEDVALKAEATLIEAEKEMILENYAKAYDLFQVALELNPDNDVIHFKIAEVLAKNGENNKAISYITQAIDLNNRNKYYYVLAAEIYKALSDYDNAIEVYKYLVDSLPGNQSYLFDLAIIYQYQGEYESALDVYERAEEIFGMNEFVLREKQKIYLKERNFDALIADWDRLIDAYPDNNEYTIELSEFLLSQNMVSEAKSRLEELLEKDKGNMKAELLLSQISLRSGDLNEAIRLAENSLEDSTFNFKAKLQLLNALVDLAIDSSDIGKVKSIAISLADQYPDQYEVQAFTGDILYKMGEKRPAVRYYEQALGIDASNFTVWKNILNIEMELGMYEGVVKHADGALEYFPNQAILYYFSGTANSMIGDYQRSVQVLEAGKKYALDPQLKALFNGQLGDSYNSLQEYPKSDEAYEAALEYDPNSAHVLNNYSYFLSLRSAQLDKALSMSTRLIELYPDDPTYLDTHGWVLYNMAKYKEAMIHLERAAQLKEDGTIIEHLGDVLFQLGKVDEAVKQWERASKLDDVSGDINKKIADRKLYE